MSTHLWRRATALATTGVLLSLTLAACSSSGSGSTAAPSSPGPSSAAPSSTPASSSPTAPAPPTEAGGGSTTPAGSGAGSLPTCRAADLRVRYADDAGGGAAGSVYGSLVFTNTSSSACAMTGWPGVSYVGGGDGRQIGAAADRTGDPTVLTLQPGGRTESLLRETQAADLGDACSSVAADGLRVYPPNSREAVFVRHPATACRSGSAHLLSTGPVGADRP